MSYLFDPYLTFSGVNLRQITAEAWWLHISAVELLKHQLQPRFLDWQRLTHCRNIDMIKYMYIYICIYMY